MKKIAIIGAGWFGLHIAKFLKINGYSVTIFESESEIMSGASSKNQNRLHLGFHYSRNKETRKKNFINNKEFLNEYGHLTEKLDKNIYSVVKKDSIIDFGTYESIFLQEKIPFNYFDENIYNLKNIEGSITCDERVLNVKKIVENFYSVFGEKELRLNTKVKSIKNDSKGVLVNNELFDYVINCTNNHFNSIKSKDIFYESCITFIYKCNREYLFNTSITLVDGDFFSIYKLPNTKNYFTVTHVKHTPFNKSKKLNNVTSSKFDYLKIKSNMEKDILVYYPNFTTDFTYSNYFISYKTKVKSNSDNRDMVIDLDENILNVFSGKILEIYELQKYVKEWLKIA